MIPYANTRKLPTLFIYTLMRKTKVSTNLRTTLGPLGDSAGKGTCCETKPVYNLRDALGEIDGKMVPSCCSFPSSGHHGRCPHTYK